LKLCPSTQTPNHLVWILFRINILPLSSDILLKMQAVYSSEKLLPRPHVILILTISFFFTSVKTWSQELWNISDRSVGGSCWENWMTSTTLFSLPTQYLMLQCFAPLLCDSFFYFPKWNKKGKRYNKTKTSRPFWNTKYKELYICRWIYSQYNCQSHMKFSTHEFCDCLKCDFIKVKICK